MAELHASPLFFVLSVPLPMRLMLKIRTRRKVHFWGPERLIVSPLCPFFFNCQNSRLERISPYSIVCINKSIREFEESCKGQVDQDDYSIHSAL
jgi:hypothetical protein